MHYKRNPQSKADWSRPMHDQHTMGLQFIDMNGNAYLRSPGLCIRITGEKKVVSLAGLAILKLLAWSDRGRENPKDAYDLIHLMNSYADAGKFDRAYDEDGVIAAGNDDAEQQVQLRLRLLQQGLG